MGEGEGIECSPASLRCEAAASQSDTEGHREERLLSCTVRRQQTGTEGKAYKKKNKKKTASSSLNDQLDTADKRHQEIRAKRAWMGVEVPEVRVFIPLLAPSV